MNIMKVLKALSNDTRMQILQWLKEPEQHFPQLCTTDNTTLKEHGVCVGKIQQKTGLSQSTTSQYLALLQDAGLIKAQRIGQWTYYQRDEAAIKEALDYLHHYL